MKVVPACPRCERVLGAGDSYCASCGDQVRVRWQPMPVCTCCGASNPVDFRFCVECGTGRAVLDVDVDPEGDTLSLQRHLSVVPDAPSLLFDEDCPTEVYVRLHNMGLEDTRVCTSPERTKTSRYRCRS